MVHGQPRIDGAQPAERMAGLQAHCAGMDMKSRDTRSPAGSILEIIHRPHKEPYPDQHRVNGRAVPYEKFPHFGNTWVKQPSGGDHLGIHHRGLNLTYDFTTWNRTGDDG